MTSDAVPLAPSPDEKDWTWVVSRPCPDCGFEPSHIAHSAFPEIIGDAASRYAAVLDRADAAVRPAPAVWSPVEYVAHVVDVCDVMTERLGLILGNGGEPVTFDNWDQDQTAIDKQYWTMTPLALASEVERAFTAAADAWALPHRAQWEWSALRSNGSAFTTESLGRYFIHDLLHHLWDVRG